MRAQLSFEYLSVYAWALLGFVVTLGALAYFGILNPQDYLPDKCVLNGEAKCFDFAVSHLSAGPTVRFFLRNDYGFMMEQTRFNVSIPGDPDSSVFCFWVLDGAESDPLQDTPANIPPGEGLEFYCPGLCNGTNPCSQPPDTGGKSHFELHGSFVPEDGQFARVIEGFIRTGFVTSDDPGLVPPDLLPPSIFITNPLNNTVVSGIVPFTADAEDNRDVHRVVFSNATKVLFTDYSPPYGFGLNTIMFEAASIQGLSATAYDDAGNSNSTQIQVTVGGQLPSFIFRDDFNRPNSNDLGVPSPGPGGAWFERESFILHRVYLFGDMLNFRSLNGETRPLARSRFARQTNGTLELNFTVDLTVDPSEQRWEFWVQLGDSNYLEDDEVTDGVAVGIRYGDDSQIGCPDPACFGVEWDTGQDIQLATFDGLHDVSVIVDLDQKEYDVYIDGVAVGGHIPFRHDMDIDTVRIFTDHMQTPGFGGRTLDDLTIRKNVPRSPVIPTDAAYCFPDFGLVSHYKFDLPGNLGLDSFGRYNLTNFGATDDPIGVYAGSAKFLGNDYMFHPDAVDLLENNFTVSVWSWPYSRNNKYGRVVQVGMSPDNMAGYTIGFDSGPAQPEGNDLFFGAIWNGSGDLPLMPAIGIQPIGTWRHYALVYDGSESVFYENGFPVASLVKTMSTPVPTVPLYVGGYPTGGLFTNIRMDELLIFNRSLSQSEILELASFIPICLS